MAPTPPPVLPATRRQRGRASAVSEIKAAALDELRLHGARGVTMRGVARAIDMTPSGLYRYFDDHGALLAALCVDAHESLRATLVRAQTAHDDDDTMTQWFRGSVVMRRWAVDHVDEYAMVVGPRLSGVDPEHPDLVAAVARLMSIPVDTVARAISSGELVPAPAPVAVSRAAECQRPRLGSAEGGPHDRDRRRLRPRRRGLARGLRPPERCRSRRRVRRLLPPGDAWHGVGRDPGQCRAGARSVLSRHGPDRPVSIPPQARPEVGSAKRVRRWVGVRQNFPDVRRRSLTNTSSAGKVRRPVPRGPARAG